MDQQEQRALDDIAAHGCHVLHVLEEGDLPPFAYSVGIQQTSQAPEVIVVGLQRPVAHFVVNEYNSRVRASESFMPGTLYAGFLEGFDVQFAPVERSHYRDYLGWARWLYRGDEFPALQLIYPSTSGAWPWDSEASEDFRARQPLLGAPHSNGAG